MNISKKWCGMAIITALSIMACNNVEKQKTITIKNTSGVARAEVASIPYQDFQQLYHENEAFKLIDDKGKEYTYQLEERGTDSVQNLLVWVEIPASEELHLQVQAGTPSPVIPRTFARYVPERFDDFAWENDKIAFRMYGKALEGRPDNAQGTDIWAKRTDKLIVNEWYKSGDYHRDHGDGLDYYDVGMTLGAGDIAPYGNDEIVFSKHYRQHEVLDNGPLRSTFKLTYEPWEVDGKTVSVTKTISLDAGSQLNRVEAVYTFEGAEKLPLVAGIVLRKETGGEVIKLDNKNIAAYWEPTHGADGTLGVAVVGETKAGAIEESKGHLLMHFEATNGKPIVYYNGGAWDKAGAITDEQAWQKYLTAYQENIEHPLEISIN